MRALTITKKVVGISAAIAGVMLLGVAISQVAAQAPPAGPPAGRGPGGPGGPGGGAGALFGPGFDAQKTFVQRCAMCHTDKGMTVGDRMAIARDGLKKLQTERVYQSIATGIMAPNATGIVDRDLRKLAEYATGKPFDADPDAFGIAKMTNNCPKNPPIGKLEASPSWVGWGPSGNNARFQPAAAAKLKAADASKLELKWAFGVPGASIMRDQPTVAFGRVFVASDNGMVYAVDAKSGCAYWSFKMDGEGRFAPLVAPIKGHAGVNYAIFLATGGGNIYAVNAQDGKEIWKVKLSNRVTNANGQTRELNTVDASMAYYDGRLYVPFAGTETFYSPTSECCRSRGGLASLDANTGKQIWRVDTIPEPAKQIGKTDRGVPIWAEAGASVWNTPTIDAKRKRVYVGTGNSYGPIAAATSDAIIAYNMADGKIAWHHQEFKGDSFMASFGPGGCGQTNAPGGACPEKMGPDWDFGGSSAILQALPNGKDVILAAGKGGIAIALDPDADGRLLWRTQLWEGQPPSALGLVMWGGSSDGKRVYYALQQPGGGLKALRLEDGHLDWNAKVATDEKGQAGAVSSIPGLVFTGGWDGVLRAVDDSGKVVWSFNTATDFKTVNGVAGTGGALGVPGAAIANGMVYITSGYVGVRQGKGGNVLLAFGAK